MAVMYSKLGGCLKDTTKLGPLARTDLCAWVKGLLDRLMNHFGLGSSKEDPWGSLLGGRGLGTFPGTSDTCLESSIIPLESLGVLNLVESLTACLPELRGCCLPGKDLPLQEYYCLPGKNLPLQGCYWGELHCLPGKKCCPQEGGNQFS